MGDPTDMLAAAVAAMKSQFDSAVAPLDASREKLSVPGKYLEQTESVAGMDALAAEIAELKCFIEMTALGGTARRFELAHLPPLTDPRPPPPRFGRDRQRLAGAPG
jgi:hypothetical protein